MELFDRRGVPIRYAEDIRYDNTFSGLTATQVQAALDEIISTFAERAQDAVAAALADTTEIDWTYDDPGNSITATLRDNSIAYARLVSETGLSVLGRAGSSSGVTAPIVASADGQVLLRNSSAVAWTAPSAPAAGLTISTALAFALANDLAALEGLASTGFAVRTTADTWAQRSLAAPAAGFTISNPAGVAGNPTFVLANDLAAVEGLASTGFAVRTTTDTWSQRTLTAPAAGFTITNPAGIAGDPTFVLANDLAGLEGLSTNGIAVRTAASTWTTRTNTGTPSRVTVSNGDGVLGDPTYDISATYVGQTSITTLGTVTTGTWSATAIGETKGGTNQTSYTLGDTLYASAANTLSKLAGNTTTTKKFLRQTGDGVNSAAPAWDTLVAGDIPALGADPSVTFGVNLTGANGFAVTYLRSDAVLKLDQAIIPTWTDTHTWTDNDKVQLGTGADLQLYHDGTDSAVASLTGALFVSEGALTKPTGLPATTRFAFVTPTANAFAVTGTGNVGFNFVRYATSLTSPGTLSSGTVMGAFRWNAHDGTAVVLGAQIRAVATATWVNTTNSGTRLDFQTTVAGTTGVVNSLQLIGNQALFPDGTAALPSLGLQNSSTAGFYRVGADNLGLALAGTLRYNFTASQFRLATTGGSISAPDLAGDGDTNTGIFWSAADTLQLALGGVAAQELAVNYVDTKVRPRRTAGSSPAALSAGNNNNYSIAANISEVRLTPNAAGSTITGITNGTNGDQLRLWNISTTVTITLLHDDGATSTAANRFLLASGTNTVLQPGGCADLSYDGTSARWRQINRVA